MYIGSHATYVSGPLRLVVVHGRIGTDTMTAGPSLTAYEAIDLRYLALGWPAIVGYYIERSTAVARPADVSRPPK